ncbi:hypothetical protein ES707_14645 [subsurface metagenome]
MMNLNANLGTAFMNHVNQLAHSGNEFIVADAKLIGESPSLPVNIGCLNDNQSRAAPGTCPIVVPDALGDKTIIGGVSGDHRGHDNPVFEFHTPDADRFPEFSTHSNFTSLT